MKIYDELGNPWRVAGGDPASKLVAQLSHARYQLVVLPIKTLATGQLAESAQEPTDAVHKMRLKMCLEELGGTV